MLCPLSYVLEGRRDSNPRPLDPRRNPRLRNRPISLQRHRWLRGHGSNADLLVQGQAWYQFHHLASVWTEGLEPPTPGFRRRCARRIAPRPGGTDGRIRTDTDGGLSAVPLPVGLRQRARLGSMFRGSGGPRGSRTRNLLLAGELRYPVAPPAHWSRERESNPRARRMRPR